MPNNSRSLTLTDIAKAAKVSKSTVSLALRDDTRITPTRRKEIQKIAQQLGYIPDPKLKEIMGAIRKTKGSVINTLAAWIDPSSKNTETLRTQFETAQAEAQAHGYKLEAMYYSFTSSGANEFLKCCINRNYPGIIIFPHQKKVKLDPALIKNISIISIGDSLCEPTFNRISVDRETNLYLAIDALMGKGHKAVGIVQPESKPFLNPPLEEEKVRVFTHLIDPTRQSKKIAKELRSWIEEHEITAIISRDKIVYQILTKDGHFKIPDDLAYAQIPVHHEDSQSGITSQSLRIGKRGIQELVMLMSQHRYGAPKLAERILIAGCWKEGDSS